MNLRDTILASKGELHPVEVPEWGCTVFVREISVEERSRLFAKLEEKDHEARLSVWVCLFTLADAEGNRLFTEDDYDALASKPAKVIDRLGRIAADRNLMQASAVEDAKKN